MTIALAKIETVNFRDLVNEIHNKKTLINELLTSMGRSVMFVEGKDSAWHRNKIATPCVMEDNFYAFIRSLNTLSREETMIMNGDRPVYGAKFGKHREDDFVNNMATLRNCMSHGDNIKKFEADREKTKKVYEIYLGVAKEPDTEMEFQRVQYGLLTEYNNFLEPIVNEVKEQAEFHTRKVDSIEGVIAKDKHNHIHCKNVLMSNIFAKYVGCNCLITSMLPTKSEYMKQKYPFYSYKADYIVVNREGVLRRNPNGLYYCGKINVGVKCEIDEGSKIKITKIKIANRDDAPFPEIALSYERLPDDYILSTEPDKDINTEYEVQVDDAGYAHVGNVFIGKRHDCLPGDVIKMTDIRKLEKRQKDFPYYFYAYALEMVYDANGITKIYTVAKDSDGCFHADNILLPDKIKCKEGDRIMIFQMVENKEDTCGKYPLMAHKAVVLNISVPEAEEKATEIVSTFEKYVKPGLKWLGAAIVAIIIIILRQAKLLKNE